MTEAVRHIPTINLADPRELERRNTQIDLEIPADSRFTTKTPMKTTNATPEALTGTWIEDPPSRLIYATTTERDMSRSGHEHAAGPHTALAEAETDMEEGEVQGGTTIGMVDTGMTFADPTHTAMKK